jgi:hypothetical protein
MPSQRHGHWCSELRFPTERGQGSATLAFIRANFCERTILTGSEFLFAWAVHIFGGGRGGKGVAPLPIPKQYAARAGIVEELGWPVSA